MPNTPAPAEQGTLATISRGDETSEQDQPKRFEVYEQEGILWARGACPICGGDVRIFRRSKEASRKGIPAELSDGTAVRMAKTCERSTCARLRQRRAKLAQ